MIYYELQNRMFGIGHLDQHFSLPILSASPPAHLFHQLKSPLIHPEFRKIQETVCIEDPYQVHMIKVQSL